MSDFQDFLLILKGPRSGEKIIIADTPLVLGRTDAANVAIHQDSVSRTHARLTRGPSGYIIEDLGSSNGTFVNDQQVQGVRSLAHGDRIGLGPEVELQLFLVVEQEARKEPGAPVSAEPQPEPVPAPAFEPAITGKLSDRPVSKPRIQEAGRTIALDELQAEPVIPPQLVVTVAGQEPVIYSLTADRLRIGRLPDNDIVINNRFVSRHHADLEKRGADYYLAPSPQVSNPLLLDGAPVMESTRLQHGAKMRVGGFSAGEMVTMVFLAPMGESGADIQQVIHFDDDKVVTIGRDQENDITLDAPTVSRYHAQVEAIGQRYRIRDLRSSNGTFVNGAQIVGEAWVHPGDTIQIGPYRFAVGDHEFAQYDQSAGLKVDMIGLNKWVRKDLNIIQDISLAFQPREFIVVVGQSGGGKSSLVDAIAGYRPATHGKVIINESIDVYKQFDSIRSMIGYVPQKDIIHMELTVFQALDYAAKLRMPADTTKEERLQRIEEVMQDLDLAHRRDTQISELSGGQQKRVSIGVELLTKPGLFFLDEPTSGLDPGMETELMQLMRQLADQGRTIILITHATKNVMLADKVIFLARGGYLTWFGPPEEALTYFDQFRTERDRRTRPMEFDEIYNLLDRPELGKGSEWAERFKQHQAFRQYIAEPLDNKTLAHKPGEASAKTPSKRKKVSGLRQFTILSARNIKILTRDRFSLLLMLLSAPLMASLDFILAMGVGRNPYGFASGDFNDVIVTLIVLTNTSILVGGLALMRELVKEREIYKRERMVNLRLSSYISSKMWFALLLAIYQAGWFTLVRHLAFDMPGGEAIFFFYVTVLLLILAGMMMGLFASAAAPNANSAPLLLILFIIPQVVLSGALVPLPDLVKAPASSRWAFQSVIAISGAGSDVVADSCWELSKEEQDALSIDQKNARCNCLGENALREESCSFPGLGQFYDQAIDQPDPVKPVEPGPEPALPDFPDPPSQPSDFTDPIALQNYFRRLSLYNDDVTRLQEQFEADLNLFRDQQLLYKDQVEVYTEDLTDLITKRSIAIGSAETTIRRFYDDYGWTFVNQEDRRAYLGMLFSTWGAQLLICLVFFLGTVFMQRRREFR